MLNITMYNFDLETYDINLDLLESVGINMEEYIYYEEYCDYEKLYPEKDDWKRQKVASFSKNIESISKTRQLSYNHL